MSTLTKTASALSDPLNLKQHKQEVQEKVVITGDGAGGLFAGRTDPRYVWVRDSVKSVPYVAKNIGAPFKSGLTVIIQLIGGEWVIVEVAHYQGTVTQAQSSYVSSHADQHLKGGGDTFLVGRDNLSDFAVYPGSSSLTVVVNRGIVHYGGVDYIFIRQTVGPLTAPTTINTEKWALIVANPVTLTFDVSYGSEYTASIDTPSDYIPMVPVGTYAVARIRLIYNNTSVLPAHIFQLQPIHQIPSLGVQQTQSEDFNETTSSPLDICVPSGNATVQSVVVSVASAAGGGSPTITIGTSSDPDAYMLDTENDLLVEANYEVNPMSNVGATPDTIVATITPDSQTFTGTVFITYTVSQ